MHANALPSWPEVLASAGQRVRASFWAAVQASLAAALAWFVAHRLLGHAQPFFSPIAAAIAMSTSYFGRSRRALQMVVGVLLGIGIAELLAAPFGAGSVALGLIVLLTMLVARLVGGGFFGEGMMFVNQAAVSAILVLTVRRHGTGAERALDALIGGGIALLVGVIVFPSAPLPRLWAAERALLESLADTLEQLSQRLQQDQPPGAQWMLLAGYRIHERLAALAQARARAQSNVRIAPRRWRQRPLVEAEDRRIGRYDLLANGILGLVRATGEGAERGAPLPDRLTGEIEALAAALRKLGGAPQPWSPQLVAEIQGFAGRVVEGTPDAPVDYLPAVTAVLGSTAGDLAAITRE